MTNVSLHRQQAAFCRELGLPQFLKRFGSGEAIAATDPAVLALHEAAIAHRQQVGTLLGASPGKLPIDTLRNLATIVGWELQQVAQLPGGVSIYSAEPFLY